MRVKKKISIRPYLGHFRQTINYQRCHIIATASSYTTQEEEYFDISATYNLGEVDANIGSEILEPLNFLKELVHNLDHARNDLDALIRNFQLKGIYQKEHLEISAGLKYQHEDSQRSYSRMGNDRFLRFFDTSPIYSRKQPTLCSF